MGRAELHPEKSPALLSGDRVIARPMDVGGVEHAITCVSMGNPHAVVFCESVEDIELGSVGPLIENDEAFPERINTEFVEVVSRTHLKMRVWERGNGETQACGTGACASAVAAILNGHCDKGTDIRVQLPGGELIVNCTDEAVYMTGDCNKVFEGTMEI
jgi:carbamoyl-phosphate synthase large subunit